MYYIIIHVFYNYIHGVLSEYTLIWDMEVLRDSHSFSNSILCPHNSSVESLHQKLFSGTFWSLLQETRIQIHAFIS